MSTTSHTGSGTLSYTIAANAGESRAATLTIAGKSITVNQSAPPVPTPTNFRIMRVQGGD
jgi:hypothetical protein